VAVLGVAFAFLANRLSPRGLNPAMNYFPGDTMVSQPPPSVVPRQTSNSASGQPPASSPDEALKERIKTNGLQFLDRAGVEKLFHDPRRQEDLILFIDARDPDHYQESHIPGAFEFYPYYPQKYLESVLTPCQIAEQIVVYCTGGDCEDSLSAALYLRDAAGVSSGKLFIYGGGFTEWDAARLPVETGQRNSGDIRNPAP
jgi:rhodanese-related sulfurtransferase